MKLYPLKRDQARKFINLHHRHFKAPVGDIFRVGLKKNNMLIGCIMVGRPVSRLLDDGLTLEVNRLCVLDGYKNACSMLYGAAARAGRALGFSKIYTYTLELESGASLRAAGWTKEGSVKGRSWSCNNRPREQKSLFQGYNKIRWGRLL